MPLKPGQAVSVTIKGTSRKAITGGTVTYAVYDGRTKIHGATDPICDFVKCPIAAGSGARTIDFRVPAWLPKGTFKGKATFKDQDGDEIFCADGYTVVG